jgi:hypothetical protein
MTSRIVLAFAAASLVLTSTPAAPAAAKTSKVALVTVVADAASRIKDLTAKDFVVREDNATREVLDAQIADDPLSIALLIDTTQPPMGAIPPTQDLRTAVKSFIDAVQGASPGAQISITEMAGAAVTPVAFTAKTEDLDRAIGRLVPNQPRDTVLLEALADAGTRLAQQPPPRRAIVSIDFNSVEGSGDRSMKDAVERVHKAGATLWAVSVRGTTAGPQTREEVVNKITQANGGMRLMPVDAAALESNLKIVANSLTSQYTVTFMRPDGANPKKTTIETSKGGKVLLTPWMR